MASVVSLPPLPSQSQPDSLRLIDHRWYEHLLRAVGFGIPVIAIGLVSTSLGLLSNQHAHILDKAFLAHDTGRLESIGFLYPPLPFLLAVILPSPWALAVIGGLAAGATAWLLWYGLQRTALAPITRSLLLAGVLTTPSLLFLASQQISDMLQLHLFLVSWFYYLNFIRLRHTWSGFTAGLILGLAFFAGFSALIASLALAFLTPLFSPPEDERFEARFAQALVILFPALWAAFSWGYTSWTFTGHWLDYFTDPTAPVTLPHSLTAFSTRAGQVTQQMVSELPHAPLFLGIFLLTLRYQPRGAIGLGTLIPVIWLIRVLGFPFGTALTIATLTVIAVAGISRRISRRWGPVLVTLVVLQILVNTLISPPATELRTWIQALTNWQQPPTIQEERQFALSLVSNMPPHRILTDDRSAYRLVAQAGTAQPFLLPADQDFDQALAQPCGRVHLVLVSRMPAPGDRVSTRYATTPPPGFTLRTTWGEWLVYTHDPATPCPSTS
jgi:hypothetical protein